MMVGTTGDKVVCRVVTVLMIEGCVVRIVTNGGAITTATATATATDVVGVAKVVTAYVLIMVDERPLAKVERPYHTVRLF